MTVVHDPVAVQKELEDLLDDVFRPLGRTAYRRSERVMHARRPDTSRLIFDADRFRWWFTHRQAGNLTLQQWRDLIDQEIKAEEVRGEPR